MQAADLEQLASLRVAVGYLGEKHQAGWWPSSFFATGSTAFLSPIFARTSLVAQYQGVTGAASKVHDERIGVGQVYHLFRLPEDFEQAVHRILHKPEVAERVKQLVTCREAALQFLRSDNEAAIDKAIGPTRVAGVADMREPRAWNIVAATYADGFERQAEIYPYFTDWK
jgi:hypothetical protein